VAQELRLWDVFLPDLVPLDEPGWT